MAGTNTDNKNAEDVKKSVCDMIDQLLGNPTASTTDSSDTPDNKDGDGEKTDTTDSANQDVAVQVADSNNEEIAQLKQEIADANEKVSSLETELALTKDSLAKAEENLAIAQTEANDMKDKCMALATANKEMVADSIIAKELVGGKITEETKDARKEELVAKSMKELAELQKDSVEETKVPRTPAQVTNPTLANPEKETDSNGSADANKETTDNNAAKKTVDDFAKDIVGKLFK